MLFAPLDGWRHVKVTEQRTAVDYTHVLKDVSDTHFKHAEKIVLVQDKYPLTSVTLRSISTRRGAPLGRAFRMALYAQAWPLARHGGVGVGHLEQ
jgi:hypothetical protein